MYVALMVRHDLDFPTQLRLLERNLAANGFDRERVRVNRISVQGQSPGQGRGHFTFTQGPLSGMTYSMVNGPAGEHVALVQFRGASRDRLKRALLQYGAVSTEFDETNPRVSGGMDKFCDQFGAEEVGRWKTWHLMHVYSFKRQNDGGSCSLFRPTEPGHWRVTGLSFVTALFESLGSVSVLWGWK